MSAVATVEEFASIETGKSVTVGTGESAAVWTKKDDGWESNGVTLDDSYFTASVRAGLVVRGAGANLSVKSWLRRRSDDHWFYVLGDLGDQTYKVAEFAHNGDFVGYCEQGFAPNQIAFEQPDSRARLMASGLLDHQIDNEEQQRSAIVDALHEMHIALCNGGEPVTADRLDETMEALGIARREFIPVTVKASGSSLVTPMLAAPEGVEFEDPGQVTIPWSFEFVHEVNAKPGSCVCDTVDEDLVALHAPEYHSLEFSVSCPNDGKEKK